MRTCTVEGCEEKHRCKGYCGGHYARVRNWGDPRPEVPLKTQVSSPEESFDIRTEPLAGGQCLLWMGCISPAGYGEIAVGGGRTVGAHRYAWEREHGPIPEGMFIDHRCYVRSCVNVGHLRLATPEQNSQNRSVPMSSRTHDLPRNVAPNHHGGYDARVKVAGKLHIRYSPTIEGAALLAQELRTRLHGEFAGRP